MNFFVAAHGIIWNREKVLVLERSRQNDYLPKLWDVPGGTVEIGETMETALRREVAEETGLTIEVGRPLFVFTNLSQLPQRQTFQVVFACELLGGSVTLNSQEHDSFRWVRPESILNIEAIPFLEDFAKRVPLVQWRR